VPIPESNFFGKKDLVVKRPKSCPRGHQVRKTFGHGNGSRERIARFEAAVEVVNMMCAFPRATFSVKRTWSLKDQNEDEEEIKYGKLLTKEMARGNG